MTEPLTIEQEARAWANGFRPDGNSPFRLGDRVRRKNYTGSHKIGIVHRINGDEIMVWSKIRRDIIQTEDEKIRGEHAKWIEVCYTAHESTLELVEAAVP